MVHEQVEEPKVKVEKPRVKIERKEGEPTAAFKGASWAALTLGVGAYLIGLFNASMELNEKGYYFAILIFGLYASVSLQKAVRDRDEGIPVTGIYYGISWFALIVAISLMAIGLYNAGSIILSEKGFYGMAFVLSLFAAITVQKNIRDTQRAREIDL
ncbi:inner membrane protein YiaA [Bacillus alkalicellulosilyticus]|uniref:inner membrane protein YiaA n=1 Tax=Alkalihalobacterium alkalicellulosilyticum TaxID=1912214 RepID=UPI001FE5D622|nr:inner membrane protein YiaA [Bacillus alkalicellulosilyticus]